MSKVSVIIPTFNCAQYITEAIESVLKQTYKDIEIIIVDDGSTDNTKDILKKYIDGKRINYVYQENQGPGAARNTGIKYATGNYIAFLDADDTFTDESIEKRMNLILSNHGVGLVFSDYFYQEEEFKRNESDIINKVLKYSSITNKTPNGLVFNGYLKDIFEILFYIHTGTVLVKKEVFDKSGLFRTDIFIAEDRDMWLRIAKHYKVGYVNKHLAYYKRYRSSLTVTDPLKYGKDRLSFHYNLLKIYHGEKEIRKFLKKRLAIIYYDLAGYFYNNNKRTQSLKNIAKSICYNPGKLLPYKFILSLIIPNKFRNILKKIKVI